MSRNPYLAASRPSSSYTRSSRTSKRDYTQCRGYIPLGRSRSSASLGSSLSSSYSGPSSTTSYSSSAYSPASSSNSWQSRSLSTSRGSTLTGRERPVAADRNDDRSSEVQAPDEHQQPAADATGSSSSRSDRSARSGLYRTGTSRSLNEDNDADEDAYSTSSSSHLKNYQQKKLSQPQPTSPTSRTRSSAQSLDSDEGTGDTATSRRCNISLDSIATTTDSTSSRADVGESLGDIVPSGSASKYVREGSRLHKSHSVEIGNKQPVDTPTLLTSSMSVDRLLLRAESMGERDLRKSFKELVMENERLKRQLMSIDEQDKQKQRDWIRTERQLQRKISELEEENRQVEQWKQEIQRLKDENSSLIRVVSKLSKQS